MTGLLVPPHTTVPSMRHVLRERTASAHGELDASVGVLDTMERYGRYLNGQFVFREAMETALAAAEFPEWFGGWRPQPISGAVRADIADLRTSAASAGAVSPEVSRFIEKPSGLVGVLYVLEGASLGARFLFAKAGVLGLTASHGARHLALQASGDGWRRFLPLLEHGGIDGDRAADAARATFAYARDVFAKELHE